jgi:Rrf2 family transcriptional regulator, iron-sulfur cluster assembly transcription factor
MKLSTRSRYGTRLMIDLAEHGFDKFVQLKDVSSRQGISLKYLEQIVIPLRKAKYLVSARGAGGGYRLAKSPGEITVGEIVALLEGGNRITDCAANPEVCDRAGSCLTRNLWIETAEVLFGKLNSVTLSDLIKNGEQTRQKDSRVE